MNSIWHAILLGIIQGITEFLPVSSSGHLELMKYILNNPDVVKEGLLMTVVLHFATALSTIVVFWSEIIQIFKGLIKFKYNDEFKFSLKIILSMIPAGLIGFLFNDQIKILFTEQVLLVGSMLIITGGLLFVADKKKTKHKKTSFYHALIIGLAQAIAILPGISRSGSTIATSVLLGIEREEAARFSFLMVIPLIIGKMISDIINGDLNTDSTTLLPLLFGFLSAFITGLIACKWMIKLVKKSKLKYFSYYCFIIGFLAILSATILT